MWPLPPLGAVLSSVVVALVESLPDVGVWGGLLLLFLLLGFGSFVLLLVSVLVFLASGWWNVVFPSGGLTCAGILGLDPSFVGCIDAFPCLIIVVSFSLSWSWWPLSLFLCSISCGLFLLVTVTSCFLLGNLTPMDPFV